MSAKKILHQNCNNNGDGIINNEKDAQDQEHKAAYNCQVTTNQICTQMVVKKVCSVCHEQIVNAINVEYRCGCIKRVCEGCHTKLPRARRDFCSVHPLCARINLEELRQRLQHVPLEM
jgi:hypothetical protein